MDARKAIVFLLAMASVMMIGFVAAEEPELETFLPVSSSEDAGFGIQSHSRRLTGLPIENQVILDYHSGPILSGDSGIPVYIIWYGTFTEAQRSTIVDFFGSFTAEYDDTLPTVRTWWRTTASYKDSRGAPVTSKVRLAGQMSDDYSQGKFLLEADLKDLVEKSLSTFPADSEAVYFVFTADDVYLEKLCRNACGSHYYTAPSSDTKWQQLPYAWVGNAASQCPDKCSWPFAKPAWGPPIEPLIAPNGDVGVEGMIINIATILSGVATDPFNNGYYQGDARAPLEAVSACAGIFGEGSFGGYAGMLLVDHSSGASYNAVGLNGRKYLLPSLWDPETKVCKKFVPEIDVQKFRGEGVASQ